MNVKRLWGQMRRWLGGLFRTHDSEYRSLSRFAHLLEGVAEDDPAYPPAHNAVVLCDESLSLVNRRVNLTQQLKRTDGRLTDLRCYGDLSKEDADKLKSYFARHRALIRDKNDLQRQISNFSESVIKVKDLAERANVVVRDMEDAEFSRRAFKQDVNILRGEKSSLEDDYERMGAAMDMTRKFTIGLVVAFAAAACLLAMLFIFAEVWVLLPATVAVIAVATSAVMIYILRRRLRHEMERNVAMQKRAVGMLNRKNVVYAHYTNFLRHQYNQYEVRNTEMLKRHLRDYESYKHLTKRLDSLRSILYQTEDELERFLKDHQIPNPWATYEQFITVIDVDDKKAAAAAEERRKREYEKELEEVEAKQARIWLELDQLAAVEPLAAEIVTAYMAAAERLLTGRQILPEGQNEEATGQELQPEH